MTEGKVNEALCTVLVAKKEPRRSGGKRAHIFARIK